MRLPAATPLDAVILNSLLGLEIFGMVFVCVVFFLVGCGKELLFFFHCGWHEIYYARQTRTLKNIVTKKIPKQIFRHLCRISVEEESGC